MSADQRYSVHRRRLLQSLAGGAVVGMAGCLGDDDDEVDPDTDDDGTADGTDDQPTDLVDQIVDGGTLEYAIERDDNAFDMWGSVVADDSMLMSVVYDGLLTSDAEGEFYNWMAAEHEATEANDVSAEDYVDYMAEYEVADAEGPAPVFDLEWPNTDLMVHPDDMAAYANGDVSAGDMVRVLTRDEAGDAVADGVFGTKVEGRIHEGIEFHNGEECTAENIVRSYDRSVGSPDEGQVFPPMLHAEAPDGDDGYTYALYTQEADAIAEVASPPGWIFPTEHLDIPPGDLDPRGDGPVPIGTGPYEIDDWDDLRFVRTDNYWLEEVGLENKDWWDGPDGFPERPPIEEINIHFTPESGSRVGALSAEEIDMTYELPAGENTAFDEDPDFTAIGTTSTGFKFMSFPMLDGYFAEEGVRRAFNYLCPRQDIVDIVEEGWGTPAKAPYPAPAADLASNFSYEEAEESDWAYPVEPDHAEAEAWIDETGLEPPLEVTVETNADDEPRIDKVSIYVDELNASGLFDATLETPAAIADWFGPMILAPDAETEYAENNTTFVIGLAAGTDPHSYAEAIRGPNNFKGCCNAFHPPGTFEWEDLLNSCRYGIDVATDEALRRDRYDELWQQIHDDLPDIIIDYGEEVIVGGPDLKNLTGYHDRRGFLTHCLYAPYIEHTAWIDRDN